MAIGRNELCRSGSGRKIKASCLPFGRGLSASDGEREAGNLATRFRERVEIALADGAEAATAEIRAVVALAGGLCFRPSSVDDPELAPA